MDLRSIAPLGLLLAAVACGRNGGSGFPAAVQGRPAENLPDRFDADSNFARIAPEDTLPGPGCLNPMHDARDGTRLVMRREDKGAADYEVDVGRYGVKAGELLRLNCNTGQALGIVRR